MDHKRDDCLVASFERGGYCYVPL